MVSLKKIDHKGACHAPPYFDGAVAKIKNHLIVIDHKDPEIVRRYTWFDLMEDSTSEVFVPTHVPLALEGMIAHGLLEDRKYLIDVEGVYEQRDLDSWDRMRVPGYVDGVLQQIPRIERVAFFTRSHAIIETRDGPAQVILPIDVGFHNIGCNITCEHEQDGHAFMHTLSVKDGAHEGLVQKAYVEPVGAEYQIGFHAKLLKIRELLCGANGNATQCDIALTDGTVTIAVPMRIPPELIGEDIEYRMTQFTDPVRSGIAHYGTRLEVVRGTHQGYTSHEATPLITKLMSSLRDASTN